jgi:hypothetical protein
MAQLCITPTDIAATAAIVHLVCLRSAASWWTVIVMLVLPSMRWVRRALHSITAASACPASAQSQLLQRTLPASAPASDRAQASQ